jgi:hypothetical protein
MFPRRSACVIVATPLQSHQVRSYSSHAKANLLLDVLAPEDLSAQVCECPKLATRADWARQRHYVRRKTLAKLQSTRDATNKSLSYPEMMQLELSGVGQRYARPRVSSRVVLATICLPISPSAAVSLVEADIQLQSAAYNLPYSRTQTKNLRSPSISASSNIATTPLNHQV